MGILIISVIGKDQRGILADVATLIADIGGNIEDVRGHSILINKGKKLASVSLIVSSEGETQPFFVRLRKKMKQLAEKYNLKITIYREEEIFD